MSEARGRLSSALEAKLTDEQLRLLLDEVLAVTKKGRGWCPSCSKQVWVEIADAKAVSSAVAELLVQAEGRPDVARPEDAGISFTRRVVYAGERDGT